MSRDRRFSVGILLLTRVERTGTFPFAVCKARGLVSHGWDNTRFLARNIKWDRQWLSRKSKIAEVSWVQTCCIHIWIHPAGSSCKSPVCREYIYNRQFWYNASGQNVDANWNYCNQVRNGFLRPYSYTFACHRLPVVVRMVALNEKFYIYAYTEVYVSNQIKYFLLW